MAIKFKYYIWHYFYLYLNILSISSFKYLAADFGAHLDGSDNAQTTFSPSSFAAVKSTPPGTEARSTIRTSFFNMSNLSLFNKICGTVLNI